MLSTFVLSALLMSVPPHEYSMGHTLIDEEKCGELRCSESVGFAVDLEVCEVLVEGFDVSKAEKGAARIESFEIDGVKVPDHELVGTEK